MLIYEVNLEILDQIFAEYYAWLLHHINIMLCFPGFQKAEIRKAETAENNNYQSLSVNYFIDNYQNLENYLQKYAVKMRKEGIDQFGDKFKATRKIFRIIESISKV